MCLANRSLVAFIGGCLRVYLSIKQILMLSRRAIGSLSDSCVMIVTESSLSDPLTYVSRGDPSQTEQAEEAKMAKKQL